MKLQNKLRCLAVLALAFCLLLTACGGTAATTMHLVKTQGRVKVADDKRETVALMEDMGLYNGYSVATKKESYAWVNLDDVKLTKMDQKSKIEITRDGKMLEIELLSGALFFNVKEPLADDETMNIRSSTMMVGIRGTCGWVEVPDPEHMNVYLLEGTVEVAVGRNSAMVHAGEMAEMNRDGEIEVKSFGSAPVIPDFVMEELAEDDDLVEAVFAASGIDVLNPPKPDPTVEALEAYRPILGQAESYFTDDMDYGDREVTVTYQYALMQMQTEYPIPALVLRKETFSEYWGDLCTALVFQYEPESQHVIQAEGELNEGVAGAGGYRGSLSMDMEQPAILETSWSSGTGMGSIRRITVEGDRLRFDTVFDGFLFDESTPVPASQGIPWCDIVDLSALDSWSPQEIPQNAQQDNGTEDGTAKVLADYAGTYTPYESFHDGYGGGERLQDVTLAENGVVTGGGTSWYSFDENGQEPSSVTPKEDGSIEITFSNSTGVYTVYPAGVVPDGYTSDYWKEHLDPNAVHLRYLYIDGGVMDILYHN